MYHVVYTHPAWTSRRWYRLPGGPRQNMTAATQAAGLRRLGYLAECRDPDMVSIETEERGV